MGRTFIYGALTAFGAVQATALLIDNLYVRAGVQLLAGLFMFIAGVYVERPVKKVNSLPPPTKE